MVPAHEVDAELLRTRDRLHKLENGVVALELLYGHHGQRMDAIEARVGRSEHRLEAMVRADEIADAVQSKIRSHRSELFSWWQKGLALALVLGNIVMVAFSVRAAVG